MPKRYPVEQRERATRMALDRLDEYGSAWAVAQALGPKLGVGPETLRKWVVQAQVDGGHRGGPTSDELAEIKRAWRPGDESNSSTTSIVCCDAGPGLKGNRRLRD